MKLKPMKVKHTNLKCYGHNNIIAALKHLLGGSLICLSELYVTVGIH